MTNTATSMPDMIKVSFGNGRVYYVPVSVATAIETMVQAAALATEEIYGLAVPVYLGTVDRNKIIQAIKLVRKYTGLSLKDAKCNVVDRVREPHGGRILIGHFAHNKAMAIQSEGALDGVRIEIESALALLAQQAE